MPHAYCTITAIEAHTGLGYDAESKPSRTAVQRIITTVARELDGALQAAGYTLPIADSFTEALDMLKGYNTLGASYRAWYAGQRGATAFPAVVSWQTDFKDALKGISENKIALPGLSPEDGGTEKFIAVIRSISLTE